MRDSSADDARAEEPPDDLADRGGGADQVRAVCSVAGSQDPFEEVSEVSSCGFSNASGSSFNRSGLSSLSSLLVPSVVGSAGDIPACSPEAGSPVHVRAVSVERSEAGSIGSEGSWLKVGMVESTGRRENGGK